MSAEPRCTGTTECTVRPCVCAALSNEDAFARADQVRLPADSASLSNDKGRREWTSEGAARAAHPVAVPALLPCPFCGGAPEHIIVDGWHRVHCTKCQTIGGRYQFDLNAFAAWNNRATPAGQRSATKELFGVPLYGPGGIMDCLRHSPGCAVNRGSPLNCTCGRDRAEDAIYRAAGNAGEDGMTDAEREDAVRLRELDARRRGTIATAVPSPSQSPVSGSPEPDFDQLIEEYGLADAAYEATYREPTLSMDRVNDARARRDKTREALRDAIESVRTPRRQSGFVEGGE